MSRVDLWNTWNSFGGPKYPNEKVVQFIFRNFPSENRQNIRILDLGCGSGVNTHFLASEGFDTTARDISSLGISNTISRCSEIDSPVDIAIGSVDDIDLADNNVDGVISIRVLDCAGHAVFNNAISEIIRVLKPGALAFLMFASDLDFRIKGNDGFPLHGFTDDEVLFAHSLLQEELDFFWMDRYVTTYKDKSVRQDEHLVTFRKV